MLFGLFCCGQKEKKGKTSQTTEAQKIIIITEKNQTEKEKTSTHLVITDIRNEPSPSNDYLSALFPEALIDELKILIQKQPNNFLREDESSSEIKKQLKEILNKNIVFKDYIQNIKALFQQNKTIIEIFDIFFSIPLPPIAKIFCQMIYNLLQEKTQFTQKTEGAEKAEGIAKTDESKEAEKANQQALTERNILLTLNVFIKSFLFPEFSSSFSNKHNMTIISFMKYLTDVIAQVFPETLEETTFIQHKESTRDLTDATRIFQSAYAITNPKWNNKKTSILNFIADSLNLVFSIKEIPAEGNDREKNMPFTFRKILF